MTKLAIAVQDSKNSKVGNVAVTYATTASCPKTCRFLDKGCYAQGGHCAFTTNRLDREASKKKRLRPIDIARAEAKEIDKLPANKPLRLHIVGDCRTTGAAEVLAEAAKRYKNRSSLAKFTPVWTYTHSWKTIPKSAWGWIYVLASCETIEEAEQAYNRGYTPAMIRYKPFSGIISYKGWNLIACREMTEGITCDKCRICMSTRTWATTKSIVCFFPHGNRAKQVEEILKTESFIEAQKEQKEFRDNLWKRLDIVDLSLNVLRKKNQERQKSYKMTEDWSLADWACAAAGEMGELCNKIKKLRRGEDIPTKEIADEIADTITYLDLLADKLNISLPEAIRSKFNEVSDRVNSNVKL
jgi:NTP pyrophosphatase (non-canonical NTP hydrolase)